MKKKRLKTIENEILRIARDVAVLQDRLRTAPVIGRVCSELSQYERPDGLTDEQWEPPSIACGAYPASSRSTSSPASVKPPDSPTRPPSGSRADPPPPGSRRHGVRLWTDGDEQC
jgi:hypothetical protein